MHLSPIKEPGIDLMGLMVACKHEPTCAMRPEQDKKLAVIHAQKDTSEFAEYDQRYKERIIRGEQYIAHDLGVENAVYRSEVHDIETANAEGRDSTELRKELMLKMLAPMVASQNITCEQALKQPGFHDLFKNKWERKAFARKLDNYTTLRLRIAGNVMQSLEVSIPASPFVW